MRRGPVTDIVILGLLVGAAGCALQAGGPFLSVSPQESVAPLEGTSPIERLLSVAPEGGYLDPAEVAAKEAEQIRNGQRHAQLRRGNSRRNEVALTFDDGPHQESTRNILAVLSQKQVRATFFVVGQMAAAAPDLVRAEVADGHEIGNHTYHHLNLQKIPPADAAEELELCSREIEAITGRRPSAFRPPGGRYDGRVAGLAKSLGLATVLWTDDPGDYASPGEQVIMQRVFSDVGPGSVILLHDGIDQTIRILPPMIDLLRSRGLEFVTVSEMLAHLAPADQPADPRSH